ncbi:MAG: EAL domain-containing protein [Liquorilactobacillus ghanensis]|uniref:EAL domain-containing protein n=1 Tax=Liquorilactobacillus ghanensis TaxID=399370 RepID=UPI0039ED5AE7
MEKNNIQKILNNLFLVYQPIINLKKQEDSEVINFEALLRSTDTAGFPQKEFCSMIKNNETNKLFLESMFTKINQIKSDKDIWINLAPQQCIYPSTINFLEAVRSSCKNLRIEITEHPITPSKIKDFENFLFALKKHEYQWAFDDVGTGQNTLAFVLKNLNGVSRIKLSLLPFYSLKPASQNLLVKFWSLIAEENNIEFVVEGVSTKEMAQQVWHSGGKLQQGFFWGKPDQLR